MTRNLILDTYRDAFGREVPFSGVDENELFFHDARGCDLDTQEAREVLRVHAGYRGL